MACNFFVVINNKRNFADSPGGRTRLARQVCHATRASACFRAPRSRDLDLLPHLPQDALQLRGRRRLVLCAEQPIHRYKINYAILLQSLHTHWASQKKFVTEGLS